MEIYGFEMALNFWRQKAAGKPARVVFATITIRGGRIKAIIDQQEMNRNS
jgi:hypothetical protein